MNPGKLESIEKYSLPLFGKTAVEQGFIQEKQLKKALEKQREEKNKPLGKILAELRYMQTYDVLQVLKSQKNFLNLPFQDWPYVPISILKKLEIELQKYSAESKTIDTKIRNKELDKIREEMALDKWLCSNCQRIFSLCNYTPEGQILCATCQFPLVLTTPSKLLTSQKKSTKQIPVTKRIVNPSMKVAAQTRRIDLNASDIRSKSNSGQVTKRIHIGTIQKPLTESETEKKATSILTPDKAAQRSPSQVLANALKISTHKPSATTSRSKRSLAPTEKRDISNLDLNKTGKYTFSSPNQNTPREKISDSQKQIPLNTVPKISIEKAEGTPLSKTLEKNPFSKENSPNKEALGPVEKYAQKSIKDAAPAKESKTSKAKTQEKSSLTTPEKSSRIRSPFRYALSSFLLVVLFSSLYIYSLYNKPSLETRTLTWKTSSSFVSIKEKEEFKKITLFLKEQSNWNPSSILSIRDSHGKELFVYARSYALLVGIPGPSKESRIRTRSSMKKINSVLKKQGFQVKTTISPKRSELDRTLKVFSNQTNASNNRRLIYFIGPSYSLKEDAYILTSESTHLASLKNETSPSEEEIAKILPEYSLSISKIKDYFSAHSLRHTLFLFDNAFNSSIFPSQEQEKLQVSPLNKTCGKKSLEFIVASFSPTASIGVLAQGIEKAFQEGDKNEDHYLTSIELANFLRSTGNSDEATENQVYYGKWSDQETSGCMVFDTSYKRSSEISLSWNQRLNTMKTAFEQTKIASSELPPSQQIEIWKIFIQTFSQKNPYTKQDGKVRKEVQKLIEEALWKNRLQLMGTIFYQIENFAQKSNVPSHQKAHEWQRFLKIFSKDIPFSTEDNKMYAKALENLAQLKKEKSTFWKGMFKFSPSAT